MSAPNPPGPPDPSLPPVPKYGEYAPPGYVPPQIAPGYEHLAPAGYGAAGYGAAGRPARTRKTWDLVLTIVLLVMGFFGMLIGVVYGVLFTDPTLLDQAFQQQNLGSFDGDVGAAPGVLIGSHLLLYLLALGGSIPLLITKRVAFWVPLTAGVIAAIVFWATLTAVMLSDPDLMTTL